MSDAIPERPYVKPWYRIATEDGRLLLEYGQVVTTLSGRAVRRLLPALLPLLDGTRTHDEITATLGEPIQPAIHRTLSLLAERGLLTNGPPLPRDTPAPIEQAANFLSASAPSLSVSQARAAVGQTTVGILGSGALAAEIARLLRVSGVGDLKHLPWREHARSLTPDDFVIVAAANEDLAMLERWNRRALAVRVPWLQVLPYDGKFAAIGPLYLPGETCCYECYRLRRLSNVGYSAEFSLLERSRATYPAPPSIGAITAGVATTLALRWLAYRDRSLPGAFHALEHVQNFDLTFHRVYRVPRCPACSGLADIAPPLPWYKEVSVGNR
jgi:bacteriocin biosynthesis cyclodehydratase domain-containing protein